MHSHFFAYLNRMKYIRRWGLMRATQPENDMEHALQVALLAHGMALMAGGTSAGTWTPNTCWPWQFIMTPRR